MKYLSVLCFGVLLAGCTQKDYFFEDTDDPGISRVTTRGYGVTSAYIDGLSWVRSFSSSNGPAPTTVTVMPGTATTDTMFIAWQKSEMSRLPAGLEYNYLVVSMPVPKHFSVADFIAFNGQTFPQGDIIVNVSLSPGTVPFPASSITGTGRIFFISIRSLPSDPHDFGFSGLFEGTLSNGVKITKGRFDYSVFREDHNLE